MSTPQVAFARARSVSFDFDGVLASLVLGRRWAKTRRKKPPVPVLTRVLRALKHIVESVSERSRRPYPGADDVLRRLRSSGLSLSVLTSRADERITAAESYLDRVGWRGLFDRFDFNTATEDADSFKEAVLRAHPVDVHVDDDPAPSPASLISSRRRCSSTWTTRGEAGRAATT